MNSSPSLMTSLITRFLCTVFMAPTALGYFWAYIAFFAADGHFRTRIERWSSVAFIAFGRSIISWLFGEWRKEAVEQPVEQPVHQLELAASKRF